MQTVSYALIFIFTMILPFYLPIAPMVAKASKSYRIQNYYLFSFLTGFGLYAACTACIMYWYSDTPAGRTFYVPATVALAVLFAMIIFIRNAYITEVCGTPDEITMLKMTLLVALSNVFIVGLYILITNYDFNAVRDFMKIFMLSLADSTIRKDKAKKFEQDLRTMMEKKDSGAEAGIKTFLYDLMKIEDRDVFLVYLDKYIEYYTNSIQEIKTSSENSSLFDRVDKLEAKINENEQIIREEVFKYDRKIKVAQKAYEDYIAKNPS